MTLKSDAKFEEKLTLGSKNDMRNLVNFNASSGKSENLHFDLLLLSIAYKVLAKKSAEELSLMTVKVISHEWSKLWIKTQFLFEKWHEKFDEF